MADATAPPNIIVPGPFANYGTVTLNPGGSMQIYVQTTVTITTLTKNS
jgi:hypothetical protein